MPSKNQRSLKDFRRWTEDPTLKGKREREKRRRRIRSILMYFKGLVVLHFDLTSFSGCILKVHV
jgi:hypothetical protein